MGTISLQHPERLIMLRLSHAAAFGAVALVAVAAAPGVQAAATPADAQALANKAEAALQGFKSDAQFSTNVRAALNQGYAVLVVPDYVRAGIGIGGATGTGVLLGKEGTNWGAPKFFDVRAATLGPQLGYTKGDLLLVLNKTGLDLLNKGDFTLSADMGFQLGANQSHTELQTTTALEKTGVIAFMRGEGAYAGATIGGAKITPDEELNRVAATGNYDKLRAGLVDFSKPSMAIKP
jgi:lipid-binding SYLF domain-containing protein